MWSLLLFIILINVNVKAQVAAQEHVIVRTAGENVTLDCPQLEDTDEFNSIIWYHNASPFIKIGKNQLVEYTPSTLAQKVSVTSRHQIIVTSLGLPDSGLYICQIYVLKLKDGSWEPRKTTHNLLVKGVPSAPGKPKVKNVQSRQTDITWLPGNPNNSPILYYIVNIRECDMNNTRKEVTPNNSTEITVPGLLPYTCYTSSVSAVNALGQSVFSETSDQFFTLEEAPAQAPHGFQLVKVSDTEIELEWKAPPADTLNGQLEGFVVGYGTAAQGMKSLSIEDPQRTRTLLQGLKPFTLYMVSVKAKNKAGVGPEVVMEVRTDEGLPLKPRITHISNHKATSFYVNWEPPREINGKLIKYELQWINNGDIKSRYIAGHLIDTMTAFISDLTPYTEYKVQVAAVTNAGTGEFSDQFPALTDVAAPGAPRNFNVTVLSTSSIHLSWDPPLMFYKIIDDYLIKGFDHRGRVIEVKVKGLITQHTLKNLATNSRYQLKVAAITNAIFSSEKLFGDFTDTEVISLGEISDEYVGAQVHPGLIVGIVFGVLSLFIVAIVVVGYRFYTCRKCYQAAYLYLAVPSNGHSIQQTVVQVEEPIEDKQYPDIDVLNFIDHVKQMHMDGDIAFSQEFDEINRISFSDKLSYENSNLPDNRSKNRYINIVAYDHSRVILKTELGRLRQSDYINANYVDGYKKPKAYIATQGPLPQTFADFWRMVWEQNTNVIVMITNLMEKGRRKCDQYWPSDGAETYGNMNVKLVTMVHRAHYTVHVFTLRNVKEKKRSMKGVSERTIYHYHYTEWPDHGVPDYALPVLSFVQKSAAQSGPESGPIIVHCSAGVGRTGTYILIDSMIARIQDQKTVNIPGFTQHIRKQRNFLVQTEDQYIFIHEVLVEYLLSNGATEVKEDHLLGHLSDLEQYTRGAILPSVTDTTLLEMQFQQITKYKGSEDDFSAALKPINQEKNRIGSVLPVNLKRVLLPARPGIDGSDYINATYLQGYKKSAEFIVTQHPTEDTMEDFWRMVWDKNSPVIVVLSPIDDVDYKEFWPPKGSSIDVDSGNFRLSLKDELVTDGDLEMLTLEFILDSIQYDYTLMTRIVCIKAWPASCAELHQVFNAIVAVHGYINSLECGPIIVMDRFGGVEAGTFCALWTLRDQLLSEKCSDFYQVCKLYNYKRPGIVGTQENYLFLHQAMAAYLKHLQDERPGNGSSPRHNLHNPLHHGSVKRNGSIPQTTSPVNSRSAVAWSNVKMGRSNSGDSNSIVTTPILDGNKVESDI
ncbi:hypothetical protein BsWGS_13995 [Bradybaena similaris]